MKISQEEQKSGKKNTISGNEKKQILFLQTQCELITIHLDCIKMLFVLISKLNNIKLILLS